VSVTVAITCLTTAIALISVFTEFVHIRLLRSRLSYSWILATSLLVTFAMSCIEFQGITAFLAPILMMFYPGLIVLTLLSFFAKKIPSAIFRPLVIASFIASVFIYFFI
jgi:LIVCS family branched-chain amino acid:cation transporter